MRQIIMRWWKKEVLTYKRWYVMLGLVLAGGFFVRVYRLGDLLGFYYDQGRDALVIWDLWHKGRLFLIGPTTGIEGIFLGPLYYWVIAPFYLIWRGDPVGPAVFLAVTNVVAIYLVFWLGKRYFSFRAGCLAAFLLAFSYPLVLASRWLANPTPLTLVAVVMLVGLGQVVEGKAWGWVLAVAMAAAGLQFEAASATFFLPALLIFLIWQRRMLNWRVLIVSAGIFLVFLLPQLWFNFRHQGVLAGAFEKFLVQEKSFRSGGIGKLVVDRLELYRGVFWQRLWPQSAADKVRGMAWVMMGAVGANLILFGRRVRGSVKGKFLTTAVLFWVTPLASMLFYQGNHGYIWDYYFSGVFPIFMLLLAVGIWEGWWVIGILGVVILWQFVGQNCLLLRNYLSAGVDGPNHITFGNMKQAVRWIYEDAGDKQFNVDSYVPPVIPYSYDYLYLWMGTSKYGRQPETGRVSRLYTLYEVDPPHPERLEAWMERQKGIGKIETEVKFGGVGVQLRTRL